MTKVPAAVRTQIRAIVDSSREYDASTMQIGQDGVVTARKDADKTAAGNDARRYIVGHINDLMAAGR